MERDRVAAGDLDEQHDGGDRHVARTQPLAAGGDRVAL
jgi:hypothetical protein